MGLAAAKHRDLAFVDVEAQHVLPTSARSTGDETDVARAD